MAPTDLVEFCETEWQRLVGALSLYTGDRDLAQELAQEALVQTCRHWSRVREMDAPVAWLHRVARNLAHSHFRRTRAQARAVRKRGPDRVQVDQHDDAIAIRAAVASLPTRERDVLVLRFYVDCSVRETARILSCPEGTVKTLTHRAVGRLRAAGFVDEEILDG